MSHIVEAKTSIANPDLVLLGQAVELVAQQHGGSVQNFYLSFNRKRHRVNTKLALHSAELHRGIGIQLSNTGELTFVGDPWGAEVLFTQVQQEIVQAYVSLATMQALNQLGYTTQAIDGENRQVIIQGVNYA